MTDRLQETDRWMSERGVKGLGEAKRRSLRWYEFAVRAADCGFCRRSNNSGLTMQRLLYNNNTMYDELWEGNWVYTTQANKKQGCTIQTTRKRDVKDLQVSKRRAGALKPS